MLRVLAFGFNILIIRSIILYLADYYTGLSGDASEFADLKYIIPIYIYPGSPR